MIPGPRDRRWSGGANRHRLCLFRYPFHAILTDNVGSSSALQAVLKAERIDHPAIRAAALRFERESGRSLANELGDERDQGIIAIFLTMNGYPPDLPGADFAREDPDDAA